MHLDHATPIETMQRYARGLGKFFTLLAALMAGAAGFRFGGDSLFASLVLAGLLAGLTVATAYMLNFIDLALSSGERAVAVGLAIAYGLMCLGEYGSHVAFGTSHRASNIEHASLQNTAYDDQRKTIKEGETNIAMWSARLGKLEAEASWVTTQTADALRAEARAEEMRGGCRQKCESIKAKIALAEEATDLRSKIEATKAIIAKERSKSAGMQKGDSVALNQSQIYATAFTGSLAPSAVAIAWANYGIGAYLSLLSTFLGTLFNWLGFHKFRRKADPSATVIERTVTDAPLARRIAARLASEPLLA